MWDILAELLGFFLKIFLWIVCLYPLYFIGMAVLTAIYPPATNPTSFVQAYSFCSEVARATTLAEFKQARPKALENQGVGGRGTRSFDDGSAIYLFLDDKLVHIALRNSLSQNLIDKRFDDWSKALGRPESEVIPPGMDDYGLTRFKQWYLPRYDLEIAAGQIGQGKDAVFYTHCRARSKINELIRRPPQ